MGKKGTLTLAAAFFAAAGLLPLLALLLQSLFPGGRLSLSAYEGILASPRQWTLLGNSFGLAALVTFFSSALGVPLGILLGRTDLPFRRLLLFLFLLPLLVPPYVTAVAWFDLLGKGGLLSPLLGPALTSAATDLLFGLPGCVLVLSTVYLPIPMLLALFFLQTVNPRLEEAARLSARWPRVLAGVTLPLILPALLAAALLVFLLSLGEFSVPNYLRFPVFPTESFTRFSAFYDFAGATASALPLALAALVLLGGEALFLDKKRASLRPAPGAGPALPIPLGRIKNRLFPAAALLLALLVLLPFSALRVFSASVHEK